MNLTQYRESAPEQLRTDDLMRSMPLSGKNALDIGARDGHFSLLMAQRFDRVVALDLTLPNISHPKVNCVAGNAADLQFADDSFDFVLCAEVLEHIPPQILSKVCAELQRVCSGQLLIGVPFRQDIRVGRTTCRACGGINPPWGHLNCFDEKSLAQLFSDCTVTSVSMIGQNNESTNALSTQLMDWAGNPYGTYEQDETCIHCSQALMAPSNRGFGQKVLSKLGFWSRRATERFQGVHGNWIHMQLEKTHR